MRLLNVERKNLLSSQQCRSWPAIDNGEKNGERPSVCPESLERREQIGSDYDQRSSLVCAFKCGKWAPVM